MTPEHRARMSDAVERTPWPAEQDERAFALEPEDDGDAVQEGAGQCLLAAKCILGRHAGEHFDGAMYWPQDDVLPAYARHPDGGRRYMQSLAGELDGPVICQVCGADIIEDDEKSHVCATPQTRPRYTPEASAEAAQLVTRFGLRMIHDARDPLYADPTKYARALQEMHDASSPLLAFVARLEEKVAQFERWGTGNARTQKPVAAFALDAAEPDDSERATGPAPERLEDHVEPRERYVGDNRKAGA